MLTWREITMEDLDIFFTQYSDMFLQSWNKNFTLASKFPIRYKLKGFFN